VTEKSVQSDPAELSDELATPINTLTIDIDSTLIEHVRTRLERTHRKVEPEALIAALVTSILDNSIYPISANRTESGTIRIGYRLRSFCEPIL